MLTSMNYDDGYELDVVLPEGAEWPSDAFITVLEAVSGISNVVSSSPIIFPLRHELVF